MALKSLFAATAVAGAASFRSFPLYKQCDPRWANQPMGINGPGERATICAEGCAMTSLSMALAGLGATVEGQVPTPATLDNWLMANQGYVCMDGDCNNLVLDAVTRLNSTVTLIGENPAPPVEMIQAGLTAGDVIFIAHVHNRTHFVLLTGFDPSVPDTFTVNDALYDSTSYPYGNISDIIMYYTSDGHLSLRRKADSRVANRHAIKQIAPVKAPKPIIPYEYPLYKQCDPRWGNDIMVTVTICSVGCLMSSTSMALGGKNITIQGNTSNPGTFNAWLRTHNGYDSGNDLLEENVPALNPAHVQWPSDAMHTKNDIPLTQIQQYLRAGRPVIANVMKGRHFVLVTGWDENQPDTLYVNDPGFSTTTYSYSNDVVGWRLFDMEACAHSC